MVNEILKVSPQKIHVNNLKIISKESGLQHLFNVFSPISDSELLLKLKANNFDETLLNQDKCYVVNLDRKLLEQKDFRMNERIFRNEGSQDDPFSTKAKMLKNHDYVHNQQFKPKSIVLKKQRDEIGKSPLELARDNWFHSRTRNLDNIETE